TQYMPTTCRVHFHGQAAVSSTTCSALCDVVTVEKGSDKALSLDLPVREFRSLHPSRSHGPSRYYPTAQSPLGSAVWALAAPAHSLEPRRSQRRDCASRHEVPTVSGRA